MGFLDLAVYVVGFWVILHVLRFLSRRRYPSASYSLPGSRSLSKPSSTNIVLEQCYLRAELKGLNRLHDDFVTWLEKSSSFRQLASLVYDLGSVLSLIGVVLAIVFLGWTLVQLGAKAFTVPSSTPSTLFHVGTVYKRQLQEGNTATPHDGTQRSFVGDHPISFLVSIPGVTIPFSHLIPLLVTLLIAQGLHEVGHAFAAALDSIPILSCGLTLTLIVPAAFVSLPSHAVKRCSPRSRLRIISSGPFHNLVLWAAIALWTVLGIDRIFWSLAGYQYVGHFGRAIVNINTESSLHQYLPIGSIITKLDDYRLVSFDSSHDPWTEYLTRPIVFNTGIQLGWCVARDWVLSHDESCCTSHNQTSGVSCFASKPSASTPLIQRCLPPLTILDVKSSQAARRCSSASDCTETDFCLISKSKNVMMRIEYYISDSVVPGIPHDDLDARLKSIVWSGPKEEILEDVEVGTYLPRFPFLPRRLPTTIGLFVEYLSTLSLSLFLLNLLPLPLLDGGQLLDAALDFAEPYMPPVQEDHYSLSNLEAGNVDPNTGRSIAATARWKQQVLDASMMLTAILLSCCGSLGLINIATGK
ncbi:unnamed protein product [Somion occarium]|uniref:Endopeptidase S2P n=1 Tax=Somion occarium TaxID=3059160 RepID=A0ABP1DSI8_9APHY